MSVYDRPTHALMHEFAETRLKPGQEFTKRDAANWFAEKYPKIKRITVEMHVDGMSVNSPSDIIRGSHEIYFAGLAYHRQNMKLMMDGGWNNVTRIYGTAFGLSEQKVSDIQDRFSGSMKIELRRDWKAWQMLGAIGHRIDEFLAEAFEPASRYND